MKKHADRILAECASLALEKMHSFPFLLDYIHSSRRDFNQKMTRTILRIFKYLFFIYIYHSRFETNDFLGKTTNEVHIQRGKGEEKEGFGNERPVRSTIAAIYSVRAGRAGCPLFSVTYIDNPARPRHGGPSRVPQRVCLVAQYLDGEARTHKGGPTGPAGPSLRETGASLLSLSPSSPSISLCSFATFTAPSAGRPRG